MLSERVKAAIREHSEKVYEKPRQSNEDIPGMSEVFDNLVAMLNELKLRTYEDDASILAVVWQEAIDQVQESINFEVEAHGPLTEASVIRVVNPYA